MSFPQRLMMGMVGLMPRRALSRRVRQLATVRSAFAVRQFAALTAIDLQEAEKPLEDYASVLELFTRRLRPGARPIDPRPESLVSPVDGRLLAAGPVGDGVLVQAKGRAYSLDAVLAETGGAQRCRLGAYFLLYLSPRDYHRVHVPVDGTLAGYTYVPGDLFPVNAASTRYVDRVYARNERVITHIRSPRFGRIDVIKVGATNIGRIRLAHHPELVTNRRTRDIVRHAYEPPIAVQRGDELAIFELGSTVIMITERPVDARGLILGMPVRVGRALGVGTSP